MEAYEQSIKIKHLEKLIQDQNDIISSHKKQVKEAQEEIWNTEIEQQVKGEFYSTLSSMDAVKTEFDELGKQLILLRAELTVLQNKSHVFNEKVIGKLEEKIKSLQPQKLFKPAKNMIQPLV